jgi:uncharacterized membrane protein
MTSMSISFKRWLTKRCDYFGGKPLCNRKADRAPHIGKYCFILCWRCSSIAIGIIAFIVFAKSISILITICLIAPTVIDGFLQNKFKIESTNFRRAITGLIAGYGIGNIIIIII